MIDLDHFKQVNDAYGHTVGDRVLQAVADVLSASARRYDVVGRWGGEEFVVLCPEVTKETLRAIAERIRERVRELRVPVEGTVVEGLTVSIGIALYPEFGPELQDVLLAADDALFVAKDSGPQPGADDRRRDRGPEQRALARGRRTPMPRRAPSRHGAAESAFRLHRCFLGGLVCGSRLRQVASVVLRPLGQWEQCPQQRPAHRGQLVPRRAEPARAFDLHDKAVALHSVQRVGKYLLS